MPTKRLRILAALALVCATAGGVHAAGEVLEPGVKALKAGKHETAIKAFSQVLGSKATAGPDLAKAYLYRGTAYARSGKPAQAIADLSNALWLRGGLSDEERQSALTLRAAAYEQTGFTSRAQADLAEAARLAGGGAQPQAAQPVATEPAAAGAAAGTSQKSTRTATSSWQTEAAPEGTAQLSAVPSNANTATQVPGQSSGGIGGFFSGLFSSGSGSSGGEEVATTAALPSQTVSSGSRRDDGGATGSVRNGARTRDGGSVAKVAVATTPAISSAPAATEPATAEVTGWGDVTVSAPATAKAKPVEVASSEPAASWQTSIADSAPASTPQAQPQPAPATGNSSGGGIGGFFSGLFGGSTTNPAPAPAETASIAQPAAAPQPQADTLPWSAGTATTAKGFRLQVASVRNPAEASAIASDLQTRQTALLATHAVAPQVSQQLLGSMGTFYQVTVGPFADERTSLKACNDLRRGGYDCFPVED